MSEISSNQSWSMVRVYDVVLNLSLNSYTLTVTTFPSCYADNEM